LRSTVSDDEKFITSGFVFTLNLKDYGGSLTLGGLKARVRILAFESPILVQ